MAHIIKNAGTCLFVVGNVDSLSSHQPLAETSPPIRLYAGKSGSDLLEIDPQFLDYHPLALSGILKIKIRSPHLWQLVLEINPCETSPEKNLDGAPPLTYRVNDGEEHPLLSKLNLLAEGEGETELDLEIKCKESFFYGRKFPLLYHADLFFQLVGIY